MTRRRANPTILDQLVLPRALILIAIALSLLLGACTTDDDEGDETATAEPPTPTTIDATAAPTPTTAATAPAQGDRPSATFPAGTAHLVSDGVCQALVPDGWVDFANGRGTTLGGHSYTLFGGQVRDDAAWERAVTLFMNQVASRPDAQITEGDDFIRAIYANDQGFAFRGRYGDRYCDFSVTSRGGPVSEAERATWDAVMASLTPVG